MAGASRALSWHVPGEVVEVTLRVNERDVPGVRPFWQNIILNNPSSDGTGQRRTCFCNGSSNVLWLLATFGTDIELIRSKEDQAEIPRVLERIPQSY